MAENLYKKLDIEKHEIRLVRLYPPNKDSIIICELFVARLDYVPYYEALSYYWGPSKHDRSVRLNGHSTRVTDNLYLALCRLQPREDARCLWIDQLCINQSDDDERGQQVALMGRIYSYCHQALLWIGDEACIDPESVPDDQVKVPKTIPCTWNWVKLDGNEDSHAGLYQPAFHKGVISGDLPQTSEDSIYLSFSLVSDLANARKLSDITGLRSEEGIGRESLRALWFIMHRPWWSRVWTLQECLLPLHALLIYGPVTAPFAMFLDAASSYNKQITSVGSCPVPLPRYNAATMRQFSQTLTDINTYRQKRISGGRINLVSALRSFRVREATDDRDKVYGLLGLDVEWYDQQPVRANYHLEMPQVYQDITFRLISGSKSLQVLLNNLDRSGDSRKRADPQSRPIPLPKLDFVSPELNALLEEIEGWKIEMFDAPHFMNFDGNYPSLPSWVPDWSSSTNFEVLSRYDQADLYSAARNTIASATLIKPSTLVLKGLEVDTVRWTSQIMAFTGGEDRSSLFRDWREFSKDAFVYDSVLAETADCRSNEWSLSPLDDAFWRTLCGDTIVSSITDSIPPLFCRATLSNYRSFLLWCSMHEPGLLPISFEPSSHLLSLPHATLSIEEDINNVCGGMESAIRAATSMRRIFVTKKGYLGLGPPRTVGGEKIFILHGGKAPFLLRDKNVSTTGHDQTLYYELVGDCYVHGIMDGEAMDWNLPETEVRIT